MPKALSIEPGDRFGRLTVLSCAPSKNKHRYINCVCDCGSERTIRLDGLTRGTTKSCGCIQKEVVAETGHKNTTHGEGRKKSSEYGTWCAMKERCLNPNNKEFKNYGGRGITVCEEWKESYTEFLEHVGRRPSPKHSVDRIDNNRGYEPGNVKWSVPKEQLRNMRDNRIITFRGESKCLTDWAEEIGMDSRVLWNRLNRGWSTERALLQPLRRHKNRETK